MGQRFAACMAWCIYYNVISDVMGFAEGDFVEIEYSIWRASDNMLMSTTSKELAEKNSIYDKDARYAPRLVILGKDDTLKGIAMTVSGMDMGETKKVVLEPGEAFGLRENDLVKVMRLTDFRKKDIEPEPGMQIHLDGVLATVKSVNSGRVVVDTNHPLAGEKIISEIKVVKKIEGEGEKSFALSESYSLKPDAVEVQGKTLKLRFGSGVEEREQYLIDKAALVAALFRYLDIEKIVVEEEYSRERKQEDKPDRQES